VIEDTKIVKTSVRRWTDGHPQAVLYDDEAAILLDVVSGKSVKLQWQNLAGFEEKAHPETGDVYCVLLFDNGAQIALVDPGGVAFAPSTENSGQVQGLPPVVCLKDFFTLKGRVDHYLHDHPDEPPPRECLDMMLICIAILDGARAIGFDVGDLEQALDVSLNEIEKERAQ
jgi:hypothetical protein